MCVDTIIHVTILEPILIYTVMDNWGVYYQITFNYVKKRDLDIHQGGQHAAYCTDTTSIEVCIAQVFCSGLMSVHSPSISLNRVHLREREQVSHS